MAWRRRIPFLLTLGAALLAARADVAPGAPERCVPTAACTASAAARCSVFQSGSFRVRILFVEQSGRSVRRPRAHRAFAVHFYVSATARVRITARRRGHAHWRAPRRGRTQLQGRAYLRSKGLSGGVYKLRLSAVIAPLDSAGKPPRQCTTRRLTVR